MTKQYKDMNVLELKGVLFDLNEQMQQLQKVAQEQIVPVLQKKIIEERKEKIKTKDVVEQYQKDKDLEEKEGEKDVGKQQ
jgi:phosphotransferase system IIA component